ncbi:MAG: DUF177 domain-containing protein [Chlorobium sp.]|jgi:uncharacterized protein|uniref:YceD family protein n=1 Tax=Chlorobium sp. TaxID=1095 RepID=UPI001D2A1828|nr:DUF177 domain-containing protein [Chlorobium sp.]MBN1279778.1 DUF177 domain-containing protein [Chlorobiaceae bacterium]MCF8215778.1 DUF177 domain-containing protein [Chlorobium sp.]MCF8270626.1 DUF177 domain-containing protein [Chlorobium sp.]MCF8286988.1 DUF177 domain-containing protein [Chlorobium sp.]MCF8290645.1 DUF177 domain-containing protein [Chlorobium sp.]
MHKEKALIEIRIAGLMQGTHTFEFTCRAEDFRNNELAGTVFTRDILVTVTAEKAENEIAVIIRTVTTADFTCDICLAPLEKELRGEYRIYYLFDSALENPEENDEDYRTIDKNAVTIDLTEDARETLLLSLPMKVTCTNNPDCRLYHGGKESGDTPDEEKSSWQESLEKLKNKYR